MVMMPLIERDAHEGLLNELLDTEITTTRKTEILQLLRVENTSTHQDITQMNEQASKMKSANEDLTLSNSKLFRQLNVSPNPEDKKKEDEKTFSETVTIEDLEKL